MGKFALIPLNGLYEDANLPRNPKYLPVSNLIYQQAKKSKQC